ncbi:unnamed protein product (macronuclear) [Paramecium tetraurelia]|uniref:C2H2-type domain-containing protein n=1 Tax=Paramecium tetraurelia TaxID=5888 RepID=A0BV94_PARTE|nr:uncharacterized protein GSPATT00005707001 [Paramecium tetraurelia]CAK62461.1 unnamed protein product [Paramecium tetraurelia]|eukprot:XP_001429859.1 hypothetical protein (macronuclear) [Paramecium tetraurelia strain d4-2]
MRIQEHQTINYSKNEIQFDQVIDERIQLVLNIQRISRVLNSKLNQDLCIKNNLKMEDQISLVRYFADVSKLVTICYKLSLEKQELLKQVKCHSESQSPSQIKSPFKVDSPKSILNKSESNVKQQLEIQISNQDQKKEKQNCLSQTRKGTNYFKPQMYSNKVVKVSKDDNIFNCQQCDKKYHHMKSLKRHIKWNHQIVKLTNQIEE